MKTRSTSSASPGITPRVWKEAIRTTGYLNAERFTVSEEGDDDDR